ncbi:CRISPR-associated RAMP protein, Cmr4 family [Isosphaera pallida ATCC 43644]|uniref:CRISPR-associated RAMP protein, Cmr4 family n=1 Tax=Isosphaera pallida (strain ATCC 43644 / DSM 9630 / IS1B) TaxID=575540 RepID=E8R4C6_ISOPI|nr:type III-B CRISPR module RAMP protein Cmr4 [Isosphaera pallida]ADV62727.1 CRISPR-associated RAMP protein, Cmr4 family [Isosphaera pallida ATCC 43644]
MSEKTSPRSSKAAALLILHAHSGIHAGTGQELGTVDLPIQRERVTNFPVIRGSSLKGALRQALFDRGMDSNTITTIFGPESNNASDHAGAIVVGDARLVLFPMRSLRGTFAWTTCPLALNRLQRDLKDAGLPGEIPSPPKFTNDQILVANGENELAFETNRAGTSTPGTAQPKPEMVVLEEYGFKVAIQPKYMLEELPSKLAKGLGDVIALDELKKRLAVLKDDLFTNFVSFCTEVVTRVHLDDMTKTVKKGQLWTEELLPAETVLAAVVMCSGSRRLENNPSGVELLRQLKQTLGSVLQIGGKETVGYGLCRVAWVGLDG